MCARVTTTANSVAPETGATLTHLFQEVQQMRYISLLLFY